MFPRFQHSSGSIRAKGNRPSQKPIRGQQKLLLEILEDRTLLSTSLGVTFDEGSGPLAELPLLSYSWGASNTTSLGGGGGGSSKASLQNFRLTFAPSSVEPGLWGHLASGSELKSATIHVRKFLQGAETEYLTYTLTNVIISSFSTSSDGSHAPGDTIQLVYGKLSESYAPINADGTLGTPNTAEYDLQTATSGGAGSLAAPAPASSPTVGVTFVDGGTTEAELPVLSYSWNATNSTSFGGGPGGASGTTTVQNFTLMLAPTSAEPGFWGHLAIGTIVDSATIHVRQVLGGAPTEYITFTLTNVAINSFSTNGDGSTAPQDSIQLTFGQVAQSYTPINSDGTLGMPNTAEYNVQTAASGGAGSLATSAPAGSPSVGVTFVDGGVTEAELTVTSYSWGGTNPTTFGGGTGGGSGGLASFQNFTLMLAPSSVEPGLWGHLAAGRFLDSATIHVRQVLNNVPTEYVTYTLTNVLISSFSTSNDGADAPKDSIQLIFGQVAQSYTPINSDGTLGMPNLAAYDVQTATSNGAGSLATSTPATSPSAGVTFVDGGVTEAELTVTGFSWGATNPTTLGSGSGGAGVGKPSFQNFTLALAPTSAEPGLWGHLSIASILDSVTIHVRKLLNGTPTEYVTYTLTNVLISSFSTSNDGSDAPTDTIQLTYGQVAQSYTPINPDGTLGMPNTAQYNLQNATSGGAGSLATTTPASSPSVGVTFVDGGVTEAELTVTGYSWGATNPTTLVGGTGGGGGGVASFQNFTLTLAPTSAGPGLWGHLSIGSILDSVTIHVRKSLNGTPTEYINYTLTNVLISSFSTGDDGSDAPMDTIQLTYGQVAQSYTPINPDGTLGMPNTAQYNLQTATSGGAGSLATQAPASSPSVGVTFVDGGVTVAELTVTSFSWGASNPASLGGGSGGGGASVPSFQNFTLMLAPTSAEPGLWGHLSIGRTLDSAVIHVRQTINSIPTEYITYTLTDVLISSFSTNNDGSNAPPESIALSFGKVAESYEPINPDGTLGAPNMAEYNLLTATSGGAGSLGAPGPVSTTTSLNSSQNTTTYGQTVTFTAIVGPVAPSTEAPAGTVDFFDGSTDISGPITLVTINGQQEAIFMTALLDVANSPHSITANFNGTADFVTSASGQQSQVVNPAPLTITADNQTAVYGGPIPQLTASYNGFVNGDTPASLTTPPGLTTTAMPTSPVGNYPITASGAVDPNYSISYVAGTLMITPAALTVSVNNATSVYGAPFPAFSVSYSGFVAGDGPGSLGGQLVFTTPATPTSAPGNYPVSASGLTSANYQIQYVSGTLTIAANAYVVVPDLFDPSKSVLVVGGGPQNETIVVSPGSLPGTLRLTIQGHKQDNIAPTAGTSFSRVRIYGGAGNDVMRVSRKLTLTAELYAGSGNDVLFGGGGNNIEVGGSGHSVLVGGLGRNILIGGPAGGDLLIGGLGANLQIAGSTAWDGNALALESIMAEWASKDSYATRVADIMGNASSPGFGNRHNGQYFLNTSTVFADASPDILVGGLFSRDWFFADLNRPIGQRDIILFHRANETVTEL